MTDTVYETSNPLFVDLLNNACTDPAPVKGFNLYRVETHCTAITYTAMPTVRDLNGMPTRYRVIDAEYSPC